MTGFWLAALALTAVAVAAVVLPLIRGRAGPTGSRADYDLVVYRDQLAEIGRDRERGLIDADEADAARIEVERRILAAADKADNAAGSARRAPWAAPAVGIALPVIAFGLYVALGSPEAPNRPYAARDIGAETTAREGRLDPNEVGELARRLETRLREQPDDIEGWVLLARTYMTIDAFDKAVAAFDTAMTQSGGHPEVAAGYGEALVIADQGRVSAKARELFDKVLAGAPFSPRARYYIGLALAQDGNLQGALQAWVDLKAVSPKGAPWLVEVEAQIARVAGELGVATDAVEPSAAARALAAKLPAQPPAAAAAAPPPSGAPGPTREDMEAASEMSAEDRMQMIRGMVQRLADRLEENPSDEAGWRRLANAYRVLGETEKATDALSRADALAKARQ